MCITRLTPISFKQQLITVTLAGCMHLEQLYSRNSAILACWQSQLCHVKRSAEATYLRLLRVYRMGRRLAGTDIITTSAGLWHSRVNKGKK